MNTMTAVTTRTSDFASVRMARTNPTLRPAGAVTVDTPAAQRIRMIGRVARALAETCEFSQDADWFWDLAETEVDAMLAIARRPHRTVKAFTPTRFIEEAAS
jgi:hypothetical protein